DWIGHTKQSRHLAVNRNENDRLAILTEAFRPLVKLAGIDTELLVTDHDLTAINGSGNSLAGERTKIADARQFQPALFRAPADGGGEWMVAGAFHARCQAKHFRLVFANDRDEFRLALGERAGFIHEQCVHFLKNLQGFGILDENTRARATARA